MKPFNGLNRNDVYNQNKNFHFEKHIRRLGDGIYVIFERIVIKTGNIINILLYEKYSRYERQNERQTRTEMRTITNE